MRFSLFIKLTILALAAAIVTCIVFFVAAHLLLEETHEKITQRFGNVNRLVINSILREPTVENLNRLDEELEIDIRYRDPHFSHVTDDDMPEFDQLRPPKRKFRLRTKRLPRHFKLMQADGDLYLFYAHKKQQIMISLEHDRHSALPLPLLLYTLTTFLLIWGSVYYIIRRQLAPLAILRRNMEAIGDGEWRPYHSNRDDEIGLLARGFNTMQERLQQLLTTRENFLIAASHELRSPIARLKLAAEMVDHPRAKAAIDKDLKELETLTSDLLQNARLQSAHSGANKQSVAAAQFLQELIQARPPHEQTRIRNHVCATTNTAPLTIDPVLFGRAINNLLDNALKYAEHVDINLQQSGSTVNIHISDDGQGVAEKDLPHLFEPFFRADESRTRNTGGFGLGLAIVAAIVKAHGGRITAANRQPHGLQVTITL